MNGLLLDLQIGFRKIVQRPMMALLIIGILGLGIGANTAIVSVVRQVLLEPIPGPYADRLVQLRTQGPDDGYWGGISTDFIRQLVAKDSLVEAVTTYKYQERLELEGTEFVNRIKGSVVMPNLFRLLGVQPLLGRGLEDSDAEPGAEKVILIGYGFWQRQFGGDASVIGKEIRLSGDLYRIAGVMPQEFGFPMATMEFWLPLQAPHLRAEADRSRYKEIRGNWPTTVLLRDGVSLDQLRGQLRVLEQQFVAEEPGRNDGWSVASFPAQRMFTDEASRVTVLGLLGATVLVLLIACSNTASLLLSRYEARRGEFAVRQAVGAVRLRLVRQLMVENLLFAAFGGLAGLAVAMWSLPVLIAFLPTQLPRLGSIGLNWDTLVTMAAVCLGCGLVFGMLPAWTTTRLHLMDAVRSTAAANSPDRQRRLFQRSLIVGQVALAAILLTGAGLMIRSVVQLLNVDPKFVPESLLTVDLDLPDTMRWGNAVQRNILLQNIRQEVAAFPGVKSLGYYSRGTSGDYMAEGGTEEIGTEIYACSIGDFDFFRTMGTPLVSGRAFGPDDLFEPGEQAAPDRLHPAIVNETMARRFWPGLDPLGKKFGVSSSMVSMEGVDLNGEDGAPTALVSHQVVGVVTDLKEKELDQRSYPRFYEPAPNQDRAYYLSFVVRATRSPKALVAPIRQVLARQGQGLGNPKIALMSDVLYDRTAPRRAFKNMLMAFAFLGLLLALVGLYGLLAQAIARRSREISLRMALGATRSEIYRLIVSEGSKLALVGVGIGLCGATALSGLIESQLFGINARDPVTLFIVGTVVVASCLLACLIPASRAARLEPAGLLRYE